MTPDILLLLIIIGAAMVLFAVEWIAAEIVALGVMLTLILTGMLTPEKAFAGFSSDTVMMLLGLLILTASLLQTGVVEITGRTILKYTGDTPALLLPVVMLSVAFLSSFISNTAATAFFLPIIFGIAAKNAESPSRYLLPLAFSSILSSSVTLVSTSTNIVVSGLMTRHGMAPIEMFELAPVGIPITLIGLLYMWQIGVRLMPRRETQQEADEIGRRRYVADIVILAGSALVDKTVTQSEIEKDLDFHVLEIVRDGKPVDTPRAVTKMRAGDVLHVEGERSDILKIKDLQGVELKADVTLADPGIDQEEIKIVEAVLLPRSPLIGRTLKTAEFLERYGLQVLGINRARGTISTKLSEIPLKMGDVLLLQGSPENLQSLERGNLFNIFGGVDQTRMNFRRAPLAITLFVAALAAATFKLLSLPVAVLLGAFFALATRCISPEEAYRQVDWKVLILIGSLLALGAAMEETGAGKYLAALLIGNIGTQSPAFMLAAFFFVTVLLTQPMSNQAAAIVIVPIAIQTALQLGLDPRPFAMMVAIAASCSFLTPLEPSCLMVYGPGKYRFFDFFKVGMPLTLVIFAIAIVLVPRVWPLQ